MDDPPRALWLLHRSGHDEVLLPPPPAGGRAPGDPRQRGGCRPLGPRGVARQARRPRLRPASLEGEAVSESLAPRERKPNFSAPWPGPGEETVSPLAARRTA